jgi:hypothetical protein
MQCNGKGCGLLILIFHRPPVVIWQSPFAKALAYTRFLCKENKFAVKK